MLRSLFTTSTITLTRKLFTMLLSVVVYKHKLTGGQWLGAAVVFCGISVEAFVKRKGPFAFITKKSLLFNYFLKTSTPNVSSRKRRKPKSNRCNIRAYLFRLHTHRNNQCNAQEGMAHPTKLYREQAKEGSNRTEEEKIRWRAPSCLHGVFVLL